LNTDTLAMHFFRHSGGIDRDSIQSPSPTAMESPESYQSLSTPVSRTRHASGSVSPTLTGTSEFVSKPLDKLEMESAVLRGQMIQGDSSMNRQLPPLATEHMDVSPKVAQFSCSEDTESHASLSDLSLAAFVESLYTLEIAPSDGLTSNMLVTQLSEGLSNDSSTSNTLLEMEKPSTLFSGTRDAEPGFEYAQSAFLHENLAFSVPSDMRWWDAAWPLPQTLDKPKSFSTPSNACDPDQISRVGYYDFLTKDTLIQPEPTGINSLKSSKAQSPKESSFTKNSCCGIAEKRFDAEAHAALHTPHVPSLHSSSIPEKVHCVPSPSGTHCSCRCDSGLALLSLERTLRHRIQDSTQNTSDTSQSQVMSSLVFTLSMSQSISQKCGCSADCPTCKKDPSYRSSALLLISTALQIYAKALQLFHDVLIADRPRGCCCSTSNTCCTCSGSSEPKGKHASGAKPSIDVRIGDYLPSGQNSRKIALYALKLELIDLERALARVHSAADRPLLPYVQGQRDTVCQKNECCTGESSSTVELNKTPLCLNPIDRLVIRKLHTQLNEVLHALDGMGVRDNFTSD